MSKLGPPPPEELKDHFRYDPLTGVITRIKCKFPDCLGRADLPWNRGYRRINFGRRSYFAHRIAWFLYYGDWPDCHIDRKDLDRSNNVISNLRLATPSESQCNRRKTGTLLKGVRVSKVRFEAGITKNRKRISLGTFSTEEEAHRAYCSAAVIVHGEFARFE